MAVSYGRDTCYRCFRPLGSCLCDVIPAIDNRIPVLILQHARERTHPFNTARLVALGLRQSELLVDYAGCLRRDPASLGSLEGCGVLYPHPSARDVTSVAPAERPRKLIVIDGTWSNARTLYRDLPALHALPHFTLPAGSSSAFVLRRQPAAYCLSTLEATVYALQALEPETPGISELLQTFARMQGRQLALIDAQRAEGPGGHTARYRKRQRSRESRAVPRALLESYGSLVLVYVESCFDQSVAGGRGVLCCAALRPSTGERFFRMIAHPELAAEHLEYLGLGAGIQREAVSTEQFRSDWREFLRPGELLASWNTSTLRLLGRNQGAAPGGVALKAAYYNLKRFRGSLEQILQLEGVSPLSSSPVRALQRLEQARQLAELTRRHAGA